MKTLRKSRLQHSFTALAVVCSMGFVGIVPTQAQAQQATAQAVYYSQVELDRLLAPIALYPDSLLSHVLIAATYPLEVVQAERWISQRDHLSSQQALEQAADQGWDASVVALVGTPEVLKQMSADLEWTQAIGEAFLSQQDEVLARVQLLRDNAFTAGNLRSNKQVRVERDDNVIVIENVRREIVYVPYYDTRRVYGTWWHERPPVYWSRPSFTISLGSGIHWGMSYQLPSRFFFSHFYWPQRYVVINHNYYHAPPNKRRDYWMKKHEGQRWSHQAKQHRKVVYKNREGKQKRPDYYMNDQVAVSQSRPQVSPRSVTAVREQVRPKPVYAQPRAPKAPPRAVQPRAVTKPIKQPPRSVNRAVVERRPPQAVKRAAESTRTRPTSGVKNQDH